MIGVILWSDPVDQKAVIWCEDQGDLAFMSRPDAVCLPDQFVDVGDIVEFDVATERSMRTVRNMSVVAAAGGSAAVDGLKALRTKREEEARTAPASAEILPFRVNPPLRAASGPIRMQPSGR